MFIDIKTNKGNIFKKLITDGTDLNEKNKRRSENIVLWSIVFLFFGLILQITGLFL